MIKLATGCPINLHVTHFKIIWTSTMLKSEGMQLMGMSYYNHVYNLNIGLPFL